MRNEKEICTKYATEMAVALNVNKYPIKVNKTILGKTSGLIEKELLPELKVVIRVDDRKVVDISPYKINLHIDYIASDATEQQIKYNIAHSLCWRAFELGYSNKDFMKFKVPYDLQGIVAICSNAGFKGTYLQVNFVRSIITKVVAAKFVNPSESDLRNSMIFKIGKEKKNPKLGFLDQDTEIRFINELKQYDLTDFDKLAKELCYIFNSLVEEKRSEERVENYSAFKEILDKHFKELKEFKYGLSK